MPLTFILPGARATQIIDDVVNGMLDDFTKYADEIFPDGIYPGDVELHGEQKLRAYWSYTPNPQDLALIADPDYEQRVRAGLDRLPQSPWWVNQLRIPGQFSEAAKDFMTLNKRYVERHK